MAIDFPNSPTSGQRFASGGVTWTYDGSKWNLTGSTTAFAPVGTVTSYTGTYPPNGWLKADGSSLLRNSYSTLFNLIGTTFGPGSVPGTTFALPNYISSTGIFIIRVTDDSVALTTTSSLIGVPIGTLQLFATSSVPTGWIRCDGQAISRTGYADLFASIGTTYGSGDGSTTFNVPNISGAGAGSPLYYIKSVFSGDVEPSTVAHAASHGAGGTDVVSLTLNQIPSYQSYRNRIINGSMLVNQRYSNTSRTIADNEFAADRFRFQSNIGTWTSQTITTDGPSGVTPNSIKLTNSASPGTVVAGSYTLLHQYVEGVNMFDLGFGTASAKSIVLSFYVKSSVTGTYNVAIRNNAVNRSYVGTYTINTANTWERKSIAFVGDTSGTWLIDTNIGARVTWALTAGSNYKTGNPNEWRPVSVFSTTGSVDLVTTASATWQVAGVQLEAGSVATPFEFEPFETTLRKCQRYYQGVTFISTAVSTGEMGGAQFRTPMRAAPSGSFTLYPSSDGLTGSANTVTRVGVGSVAVGTGTAVGFSSVGLLGIYCTGLSSGGVYSGHFAISVEL